jgi:hypothetical protein
MKYNKFLIAVLFMLLSANSIFAHDLAAPAWRGNDGTTFQHFTFDSNDNPASPELIKNIFGNADANIILGPIAEGWIESIPGFGTQNGIWGLGSAGTITVNVTTGFHTTGPQEIWVQMTYLDDPWWNPAQLNISDANLIEQSPLIEVEDVGLGTYWYLQQTKWLIDQGKSNIEIIITSDIAGGYIDQVVIDTRTVNPVCIVNYNDLEQFATQWLMSGDNLAADFDDSKTVDFRDYNTLANQWFKFCPVDWPW